MRWIEIKVNLETKRIEYVKHNWNKSMAEGEMFPSSTSNPDMTLDFMTECLGCKDFSNCFPKMLWSEVYNRN